MSSPTSLVDRVFNGKYLRDGIFLNAPTPHGARPLIWKVLLASRDLVMKGRH